MGLVCVAPKSIDGTGRATQHETSRTAVAMMHQGAEDEGTTEVDLFDLRDVALIRDATQRHCGF
jgi:hypothetical protein